MSDVRILGMGAAILSVDPWFVAEYRYSEYATVINLINLRGIIIHEECLIILVINIISLIKLILGGAAIFAQQNKNHHNDNMGIIVSIPLVRVILRVWVIP
jgi:hypothetical protein